jgi:DNA repair ATPase RecN
MKIGKLRMRAWGQIEDLSIEPEGRNVVLSGRNGAGKSRVVNAIWSALQWRKMSAQIDQPVMVGRRSAEVQLELIPDALDEAESREDQTLVLRRYSVTRTWSAKGTTLTVCPICEGECGRPEPSPQQLLDALLGDVSWDVSRFLQDQKNMAVKILMALGVDIEDEMARRKAAVGARPILSRKIKELQFKVAEYKGIPAPKTEVEILEMKTALAADRNRLADANLTVSDTREALRTAQNNYAIAQDSLRKAMIRLAQAQADVTEGEQACSNMTEEIADWSLQLSRAEEAMPTDVTQEQLDQRVREISEAESALLKNATRSALLAQLKGFSDDYDKETRVIEEVDGLVTRTLAEQAGVLGACSVDEEGELLVDGVRWADVSTGRQIAFACKVALAASPGLRVLAVPNASLLDEEARDRIRTVAEDKGVQLFLEVVTGGDLQITEE